MRRCVITLMAVSLAAALQASAAATNEFGSKEKTFTVAKGGLLTVTVGMGNIGVRTWEKNEVTVIVRGDEDEEEFSNVKIRQRDNTVSVEYDPEWAFSGDLHFEITIPVQFNVRLETSGGDIIVDGSLTGTLNCETSGGNIRTESVKGNVVLQTSGGDIETGDVDGDIELNTSGGNIRVGKITGTTDVHTSGGDISIESAGKPVKAETAGGNVTIGNISGDVTVETAGGDITLEEVAGGARLKTAGGNISLKSANGKVSAKTAGGDIELEHVVGSVDVKTASGNIRVELVPSGTGKSSLNTSVGDATLRIGEDAKATVNARVRLQGWWRGSRDEEYIYSDYKEDSFEQSGRDREVRARYTLNGGGPEISIQVSMGNIYIEKPKGSKSSEKNKPKKK